jgi:D-hydroxyproline dehydrogenase
VTSRIMVAGAGFVGAASALALQRAGFAVTLIDPDQPKRAASWGNAGHIAIEQVTPLASFASVRSLPKRLTIFGGPVGLPLASISQWLPFGLRLLRASAPNQFNLGQQALTQLLAQALPAWRRLAEHLRLPTQLSEQGHFVAWESASSAARGTAAWLSGPVGTAKVQPATPAQLASLKQRFNNRPVGAVRFDRTAQIMDLQHTRQAIVQQLIQAGGRYTADEVVKVDADDNHIKMHTHSGQTISADKAVIAAGIGSAALMAPFFRRVPLIAERGYHLDQPVDPAQWPSDLPPVAFEDRSVIVTRFANSLRLAGFTELTSEHALADDKKWQRLHQHAQALGLALTSQADQWVGSRPTLPDYLPAIGQCAGRPHLYYAFGHQHLGLTLAAITAELMVALVQGAQPAVKLTPFDLKRFN